MVRTIAMDGNRRGLHGLTGAYPAIAPPMLEQQSQNSRKRLWVVRQQLSK